KSGGSKGSTKVSREHTVMEVEPGLTAIAGGKFTTYRVMAEDVVDFAIKDSQPGRPSLTRSIPVIGAQGYRTLVRDKQEIARRYGFDEIRMDRLLFRYGALLSDVLALIDEDESLATPLEHAPRYLRAEVLYAVRAEGARHLADVLERRTRLDYETRDRGVAAADEVAALVGPELGWDEAARAREVETYRNFIAARLDGERTASDEQAAARLADAPEAPTRRCPSRCPETRSGHRAGRARCAPLLRSSERCDRLIRAWPDASPLSDERRADPTRPAASQVRRTPGQDLELSRSLIRTDAD